MTMRLKDKEIEDVAHQLRPLLQPIIDRERSLGIEDIQEALKQRPDLPRIRSNRSLSMIMDTITAS